MKKFIFLIATILLTTTTAFALAEHYDSFEYGKYKCPEDNETCSIYKLRTGELKFSKECTEDVDSAMSKYAPMIKRDQCKFTPDDGLYVACIYADAKCEVTITEVKTSVKCTQKKGVSIPNEVMVKINNRVMQDATSGKCKPLYTEQK